MQDVSYSFFLKYNQARNTCRIAIGYWQIVCSMVEDYRMNSGTICQDAKWSFPCVFNWKHEIKICLWPQNSDWHIMFCQMPHVVHIIVSLVIDQLIFSEKLPGWISSNKTSLLIDLPWLFDVLFLYFNLQAFLWHLVLYCF